MKRIKFLALGACLFSLLLFLTLSACAPKPSPSSAPEKTISIAATTWPVYCFTSAVTEGVAGVNVTPVINAQTSCLHDYTLTVSDMKILEGANIIVMNGVGLEDFMGDALSASSADVVDCSQDVKLLTLADGTDDPHIWMDPSRAAQMVQNIGAGLAQADPEHAAAYQKNADAASRRLTAVYDGWRRDQMLENTAYPRELITFHDGFGYFADAFGLEMLKAIEEEEGSETSAQEIKEIVSLIGAHQIATIYTEVNGSDATAKAIARETGVSVGILSMLMSGEGGGLTPYLSGIEANIKTVYPKIVLREHLAGESE